jgi:hypothetical protein
VVEWVGRGAACPAHLPDEVQTGRGGNQVGQVVVDEHLEHLHEPLHHDRDAVARPLRRGCAGEWVWHIYYILYDDYIIILYDYIQAGCWGLSVGLKPARHVKPAPI